MTTRRRKPLFGLRGRWLVLGGLWVLGLVATSTRETTQPFVGDVARCMGGDGDACLAASTFTRGTPVEATLLDRGCDVGADQACERRAALPRRARDTQPHPPAGAPIGCFHHPFPSKGVPDHELGPGVVEHRDRCERSDDAACVIWGRALIEGRGVPIDSPRAADVLDGPCRRGQSGACLWLARAFRWGRSLPDDTLSRGCTTGDLAACAASTAAKRDPATMASLCARGEWSACPMETREQRDALLEGACTGNDRPRCDAVAAALSDRAMLPIDEAATLRLPCERGSAVACRVALNLARAARRQGLGSPGELDDLRKSLLARCAAGDSDACDEALRVRDIGAMEDSAAKSSCDASHVAGCAALARHADAPRGVVEKACRFGDGYSCAAIVRRLAADGSWAEAARWAGRACEVGALAGACDDWARWHMEGALPFKDLGCVEALTEDACRGAFEDSPVDDACRRAGDTAWERGDPTQAVRWWQVGCTVGPHSCEAWAVRLAAGGATPKDDIRATELSARACVGGLVSACNRLAASSDPKVVLRAAMHARARATWVRRGGSDTCRLLSQGAVCHLADGSAGTCVLDVCRSPSPTPVPTPPRALGPRVWFVVARSLPVLFVAALATWVARRSGPPRARAWLAVIVAGGLGVLGGAAMSAWHEAPFGLRAAALVVASCAVAAKLAARDDETHDAVWGWTLVASVIVAAVAVAATVDVVATRGVEAACLPALAAALVGLPFAWAWRRGAAVVAVTVGAIALCLLPEISGPLGSRPALALLQRVPTDAGHEAALQRRSCELGSAEDCSRVAEQADDEADRELHERRTCDLDLRRLPSCGRYLGVIERSDEVITTCTAESRCPGAGVLCTEGLEACFRKYSGTHVAACARLGARTLHEVWCSL